MERIDKVISSQTDYSRNDVKKMIKKGLVSVNGIIIDKSQYSVDVNKDVVCVDGIILNYKKFVYLILNKPEGYVSATYDNVDKTVLELVPDYFKNRDIFPCGRLDKDTTGLMILSDDGEFCHNILSPRKHVSKKYYVMLDGDLSSDMVNEFYNGIKLKDFECKSSLMEIISDRECYVTLSEGKYHQIKRMFGYFGLKVLKLQRVKFGLLDLPSDLKLGECRELSSDELNLIVGEKE